MSPAFIMRTSEPYQLPGTDSFHPNNLRYNSLRSAQHPTGYHRVYVIYSAIMYREILYLIFDYPHKHHTFKHFEV